MAEGTVQPLTEAEKIRQEMENHNQLMKRQQDMINSVVQQKTVGAQLSKSENAEDKLTYAFQYKKGVGYVIHQVSP